MASRFGISNVPLYTRFPVAPGRPATPGPASTAVVPGEPTADRVSHNPQFPCPPTSANETDTSRQTNASNARILVACLEGVFVATVGLGGLRTDGCLGVALNLSIPPLVLLRVVVVVAVVGSNDGNCFPLELVC